MTPTSSLSAERVARLVNSTNPDSDVSRMGELEGGSPESHAAVMALVEGLKGWQWRVVLGCAKALGRSREGLPQAVEGLTGALRHHESSVRGAAAQSLVRLAGQLDISPDPLFEAYLDEESHLAFLDIGKALLTTLKTSTLKAQQGERLQEVLEGVQALRLTHLPLGGKLLDRGRGPAPPAPGFLARLMGKTVRAEPPPRIPHLQERVFLEREGEKLRDYPEMVSQIASVYAAAPVNPDKKFELVLQLARMPLAYFVTSSGLVMLAATLADRPEKQAALLAEIPRWRCSSDATRAGRLACGLASSQPRLRLEMFRRVLELNEPMDWTNWSYPLGKADSATLEPLVAAALEAPEQQVVSWLKLLSEAPVEPILPVLERALHSRSPEPVCHSLERLLKYGQPVAQQIGEAELLKQRWKDHPQILQQLDSLIGQSAQPAVDAKAPAGYREPQQKAEWMLPEMTANPFSRGEKQDWKDSLRLLSAIATDGGTLYLSTSEDLIALPAGQGSETVPWPKEYRGRGLQLVAAGLGKELLFQDSSPSSSRLYLWDGQGGDFRQVNPSIPEDEVPNGSNLLTDGTNYGWAERGVWKMSHFEADPGHHIDIAYHLDRASATVRKAKPSDLEGMRPVVGRNLESGDYLQTKLEFAFAQDGAFRLCAAQKLAIRADGQNPIHSSGCSDGTWAVHLEVFPSRLCRIYFWSVV